MPPYNREFQATATALAPTKIQDTTARPRVEERLWLLLKYLSRTEVHTYAFSVAANAILSFFPFMVLILTITRRFFAHWGMDTLFVQLLRDYLPAGQDFVIRNLNAAVAARRTVPVWSVAVLLISSTGVFLPLEVALNRVWGVKRNRSYLGNQLISFGLALAGGLLALGSIGLSAVHERLLRTVFPFANSFLFKLATHSVLRSFALVASIAIFFMVYWLLPNCKVPVRSVLPVAITTGLIWEAVKYLYIVTLPWLNFQEAYGPFALSVTLIMWAFLSGLILLAGAHFSASGRPLDEQDISLDNQAHQE